MRVICSTSKPIDSVSHTVHNTVNLLTNTIQSAAWDSAAPRKVSINLPIYIRNVVPEQSGNIPGTHPINVIITHLHLSSNTFLPITDLNSMLNIHHHLHIMVVHFGRPLGNFYVFIIHPLPCATVMVPELYLTKITQTYFPNTKKTPSNRIIISFHQQNPKSRKLL